jgi:hypothetical protein
MINRSSSSSSDVIGLGVLGYAVANPTYGFCQEIFTF